LLIVALQAQSQNTETYKFPLSEVVTIRSEILNENRKIYVHCPKLDSADLNKRFPVLYLMDGDNHFELLAQYADYLSRPDVMAMPKIIIVVSQIQNEQETLPQQIVYLTMKANQTVVHSSLVVGMIYFYNSSRLS
jgi:predicted alpha/beta superfamily hydrolase